MNRRPGGRSRYAGAKRRRRDGQGTRGRGVPRPTRPIRHLDKHILGGLVILRRGASEPCQALHGIRRILAKKMNAIIVLCPGVTLVPRETDPIQASRIARLDEIDAGLEGPLDLIERRRLPPLTAILAREASDAGRNEDNEDHPRAFALRLKTTPGDSGLTGGPRRQNPYAQERKNERAPQ